MATLALVNPRRRHKRRRSARRMTAKQLKYFGRRKHKRRSRRTAVAAAAPRRRRRHARRVGFARRARRSVRRFARHTGGGVSLRGFNFNQFLRGTLVPSAVGAAGALGVDLVMGYATPYLPTMLTSGPMVPLTKIAGAVALGMVAGAVTKDRSTAEHVTAGAITVIAYQWIRDMAKAQFPTLPLSEYVSGMGYAGPALTFPDNLGVYVGGSRTFNPSIAARDAGGTTRGIVSRPGMHGLVSEYDEGGYSYN